MSTIGARADEDYQRTYADFWAPLVEQPDGQLDRDKVMRELHDYHHVMDQVTQVYSEISGFSKPNTAAVHVIQAVEDRVERGCKESAAEELERALEMDPIEIRARILELRAELAEVSS